MTPFELAAYWKDRYQRERRRVSELRSSRERWKREAMDWRRTLWGKKRGLHKRS